MTTIPGKSGRRSQKSYTGLSFPMGLCFISLLFLIAALLIAPTDSAGQEVWRYSGAGGWYWDLSGKNWEDAKQTEDGSYVKFEENFTGFERGKILGEASNTKGGLHKVRANAEAYGGLSRINAWGSTANSDYFIIKRSNPKAPSEGLATACFALSGDVKGITDDGYATIWFTFDTENDGTVLEYYQEPRSGQNISWVGCGVYSYFVDIPVFFTESFTVYADNSYFTVEKGEQKNGRAEANFMSTLQMTSLEISPGHYIEATGSGDTYPPKIDPPPPVATTPGTIGTQVTMDGPGFGNKKGKVLVGGLPTKIISWTDASITYEIKKGLPVGPYNVVVQRKDPKGAEALTYEGAFTMAAPEIASVEPISGIPDDKVVISGNYFGTKKGKLYIEDPATGKKKNCKVISWGMESITFAVPKLPNGLNTGVAYPLKIINKAKETAETTFTVLEPEP